MIKLDNRKSRSLSLLASFTIIYDPFYKHSIRREFGVYTQSLARVRATMKLATVFFSASLAQKAEQANEVEKFVSILDLKGV